MEANEQSQLASTVISQIQASDLKNGMYAIHSKTGYCGQISNLKSIKGGKHGHCKVVYDLSFPHNNGVKKESFKGKKGVKQAFVDKKDYQVSYYDEKTATIVCFDDDMQSMDLSVDGNKKMIAKVKKTMAYAEKERADVYVIVMEVPMVAPKNEEQVEILQIVCDVKTIEPN